MVRKEHQPEPLDSRSRMGANLPHITTISGNTPRFTPSARRAPRPSQFRQSTPTPPSRNPIIPRFETTSYPYDLKPSVPLKTQPSTGNWPQFNQNPRVSCHYERSSVRVWPSRDPIGERGGLNLYGFGPNSPTNGYDSDGRVFSWPTAGLGAGAGAFFNGVSSICRQGFHGGKIDWGVVGVDILKGAATDFVSGAAVACFCLGDPSALVIGGTLLGAGLSGILEGTIEGHRGNAPMPEFEFPLGHEIFPDPEIIWLPPGFERPPPFDPDTPITIKPDPTTGRPTITWDIPSSGGSVEPEKSGRGCDVPLLILPPGQRSE